MTGPDFGFGLGGRVVVVFLASFFPILINTYAGVRDAPAHLIEVARSFGVSSEMLIQGSPRQCGVFFAEQFRGL